MKKLFFGILATASLLALSLGLIACGDGADPSDDKGTRYSIQAPAASDVFGIGGLPDGAYEGDTVTFTVTLADAENGVIFGVCVDPSVGSEYELTAENGSYSFTMPDCPVKITVDARAFQTVTSDGRLTFDENNPTTISIGGGNDMTWGGPNGTELIDIWRFGLSFDWGNTANFSSRSYIVSSDQNVIPAEAISDFEEGDEHYGMISDTSFYIDPAKIRPGTTWLEIYLKSNETSSDGTLSVKITVTE